LIVSIKFARATLGHSAFRGLGGKHLNRLIAELVAAVDGVGTPAAGGPSRQVQLFGSQDGEGNRLHRSTLRDQVHAAGSRMPPVVNAITLTASKAT
jgi:hypothetical protein